MQKKSIKSNSNLNISNEIDCLPSSKIMINAAKNRKPNEIAPNSVKNHIDSQIYGFKKSLK
jgi:hypothetical protein